jgi:hypothetical protein
MINPQTHLCFHISSFCIEQVHSIKTAIAEGQAAERKARQKETEQLRRQLDDLNREIPTVTDAVETLRSVSYRAVVWLTGLATLTGVVATYAFLHWFWSIR